MDIDGVDGPVVVQGIHHVLNAPVERDAWPPGERTSRLVLIADPTTITRESWTAAPPGMIADSQKPKSSTECRSFPRAR